MRMHQYLSNGSLHRLDPDGWELVGDLLGHCIYDTAPRPAVPAMTEAEWHTFQEAQEPTRVA